MNSCQTASCFVCNREVGDKGVLLSTEMTSYSKTAFPAKLMQLLGDAFMVVILEDDKICFRCVNLINKSDKLEQDLRQTKSIILGFLNEKYDLNEEGESLSTAKELEDPKDINDYDLQHLTMEESASLKEVQKDPCSHCNKEVSKTNLKRHEINCSKNVSRAVQSFKCAHCQKLFSRKDTLKAHLKKCSNFQENLQRKSLNPCNYAECNEKFNTLSSLIDHLRSFHKAPDYSSQTITFKDEIAFIDWKEEEQSRTFSYFSKKCGNHKSNEGLTKYFYCQQHGSEKAHRKKEEVNRKTDRRVAHGRTKTGEVCISSMKATYLKDGSVRVVYQPTHSHPLSPSLMQFHPLSSESYKYIDTQLAAGVSPLAIKRELKNRALEKSNMLNLESGNNHKDYYVSLKLIRERARRRRN